MKLCPASDVEAYRTLARAWAATVTVVTVRLPVGTLDGFTATGFLTVSIAPPIILVSSRNGASSAEMLNEASSFAVNLLAPHQDALAALFAGPQETRPELWSQHAWAPDADGSPLLAGTVGAFSARVRQRLPAGDHTLVLGDVTALHLDESGAAETLVYHNRGYGHFRKAKLE